MNQKRYNKCRYALEFHENSKILKYNRNYNKRFQYKVYLNCKSIYFKNISDMNKQIENRGFIDILLSRRSTRKFTGKSIALNKLSQFLQLSFGKRDFNFDTFTRTYASAGGLYPIEVYPVILKSDEVELGIYHYNIYDNRIDLLKKGDFTKDICTFYKGQEYLLDASCIIIFSMIYERSMVKYGERGYRFILIDAGHMSQNAYLVAEYLNFNIVGLGAGSGSDDILNNLLGLNKQTESVFYGMAIG